MRCGKKLASHTTNAKASRSGSICTFRLTRLSSIPRAPTPSATSQCNKEQPPLNAEKEISRGDRKNRRPRPCRKQAHQGPKEPLRENQAEMAPEARIAN